MTERIAAVPPGVDPTDLSYPLERPKVGGCFGRIGMIFVYIFAGYGLFALTQQAQQAKQPAQARDSVLTPIVITTTPAPATAPADTAQAAAPAPATMTPVPSATMIPPGAVASFTPGPWMLTKFAMTYEAKYAQTPTVSPTATNQP